MPPSRTPQLLVALCILVLGIAIAAGASFLPEARGYAGVGPRLFANLTALGLAILGFALSWEAHQSGFRLVDEEAQARNPIDWQAFTWISTGLIATGILIVPAGFVISSTVLFVFATRGFKHRRDVLNAFIGFLIALAAYCFFNYGLGLNLPKGILPF